MALVERIGEMRQKTQVKQFNYWECQHITDIHDLCEKLGPELFIEALNTGLEAIARKRTRSHSDPRLTAPQLIQVRRIRDLVALKAMTLEKGMELLTDHGIDGDLAMVHLREVRESCLQ